MTSSKLKHIERPSPHQREELSLALLLLTAVTQLTGSTSHH